MITSFTNFSKPKKIRPTLLAFFRMYGWKSRTSNYDYKKLKRRNTKHSVSCVHVQLISGAIKGMRSILIDDIKSNQILKYQFGRNSSK